MNKIHEVLLETLKDIDAALFNNVKYAIACGTALGQERNKKLIEWDDDIDLIVEDAEWDKTISILRNNLSKNYHVQYFDNDPKNHTSMIKVFNLGHIFEVPDNEYRNEKLKNKLSIDIFRVIRTNKKKRPLKFGFITMWIYLRNANYGKFINLLKAPFYIVSTKRLLNIKNKLIQKIHNEKGKNFIMDEGINKRAYPYKPISKLERRKLNGINVNAFKNQKEYLSNHYGPNFMTPIKFNHGIKEKKHD